MKIIVTGAAGLIGMHTALRLLATVITDGRHFHAPADGCKYVAIGRAVAGPAG